MCFICHTPCVATGNCRRAKLNRTVLSKLPKTSIPENRASADDNTHWFHLSGGVVEKTFDTLLIELNEKEESSLFFDTTKVSLDCTKCKGDLEQVSEGNVIKFYFFKYNIDGETVKIERIVR